MALASYAIPYGIRDIKFRALDNTDTPAASVDLPAGRTLSFTEGEDFTDLRGDDVIVATHGNGPVVSWSLEAGGISLDAYKLLAGGTVTQTGTTPNIKKTYAKLGTDARPYVQIEGQAINDNGGDLHGLLYKCKADGDIGGELADSAFYLTACSGRGIPTTQATKVGALYDFVHNETAAAIT